MKPLRDALAHAVTVDRDRARVLRLKGFESVAPHAYDTIAQFAQRAAARGYPVLA